MFKRRESQIVTEICEYLKLQRHFFWRQNNVGVWDHKRQAFRKSQFTLSGVPDIFCMVTKYGRHTNFSYESKWYAIEVKSKTGRQTADQQYFQIQFTKHGGIYILARSVSDVVEKGL